MSRIVIQYPPDFDGELHIEHSTEEKAMLSGKPWTDHTYSFTVAAARNRNPWAILVSVAKDILAQDARRSARK